MTKHRLSIRIDLDGGGRIGPGKIMLLEQIGQAGSISAAGRAMQMSYRRAWLLVENLNSIVGTPVVETSAGGSNGGGAWLTAAGSTLVQQYRTLEREAAKTAQGPLAALDRLVARPEAAAGPLPEPAVDS